MRTLLLLSALTGALALSACGERPQDKLGIRSDKPVQTGTGVAAFTMQAGRPVTRPVGPITSRPVPATA